MTNEYRDPLAGLRSQIVLIAAHVEHASDAVLTSLRLSRSLRTGDKSFDETYFVSGDAEAAKVLLAENVRKELLALSRPDVRLRIGGGLAEIGWTMRMDYKSIVELPESSVRFIVALRDAIANG